MPIETHVKDGGSWRKAQDIHVKSGGSWRKCSEVYVRNSGTWRRIYPTVSMTTGDTGGGTYGYFYASQMGGSGEFGSVSPTSVDTNSGSKRLVQIYDLAGNFVFGLTGNLTASAFTSLRINGVTRVSSSANFVTYSSDYDVTTWQWVGGAVGITGPVGVLWPLVINL